MKLLVDNQLPVQLAAYLRGRGHNLKGRVGKLDAGRLIWVRLGNCRNAALIEAFDLAHEDLVRAFDSGQRIVELR